MKKFLFSHSLLAKNKAALNRSKLTLASRLLYMSTEVANRAERVNWLMSDKLDRLRVAHAQKTVNGQSMSSQNKVKTESQDMPCRFFQAGKCSHKN